MIPSVQLSLFFLLVLGIIVLPGLDMAYVLGSSLMGGRRSGLAAVGGIMLGGVCHVVMATLGISVVLQVWPAAFDVVLWLGAAYVVWIGYAIWRSDTAFLPAAAERHSRWVTFRRGAVTCLLNPKAYLFMLAVFPQFMRRENGALWGQAVVLGLVIVVTQLAVYGGLACAAGGAQGWLVARPVFARAVGKGVGVLLVVMGVGAMLEGVRRFF
ncbi:Threonine/homoserine/homoserine lactone efflux protein [Dyella sp. OK004]|uniref:LysE family translocator n=1 Tax=Dyella sp. OK004 TaxID=1855292 RepID=UPI0008EB6798|nr:LysE family translocator [Dyella sp. OK004]SFR95136.1 Threonine/homoserine/homoserine lactone efflux protein [Dyella sp. OK004]